MGVLARSKNVGKEICTSHFLRKKCCNKIGSFELNFGNFDAAKRLNVFLGLFGHGVEILIFKRLIVIAMEKQILVDVD